MQNDDLPPSYKTPPLLLMLILLGIYLYVIHRLHGHGVRIRYFSDFMEKVYTGDLISVGIFTAVLIGLIALHFKNKDRMLSQEKSVREEFFDYTSRRRNQALVFKLIAMLIILGIMYLCGFRF